MGKNPVTRFLVTPLPVTPLRVLLTTPQNQQMGILLQQGKFEGSIFG